MCKCLGPVWVRCFKYPLLLLSFNFPAVQVCGQWPHRSPFVCVHGETHAEGETVFCHQTTNLWPTNLCSTLPAHISLLRGDCGGIILFNFCVVCCDVCVCVCVRACVCVCVSVFESVCEHMCVYIRLGNWPKAHTPPIAEENYTRIQFKATNNCTVQVHHVRGIQGSKR